MTSYSSLGRAEFSQLLRLDLIVCKMADHLEEG